MAKIRMQFTLFSAFYSPLIATMAGGFLKEEGLEADWSVAPKGVSAIRTVEAGEADLCQSAPSQGFAAAQKGEPNPPVLHFAQINEMDGFFLTAREPDPAFDWKILEGSEVVLFGGGQPLAMFKYACHKAGIDFDRVKPINPGGAAEMDAAFRAGQGTYVQQQGPFPQQLEADGVGHIVAQVGPLIGPNAFSSLAATPEWLATDEARAFTRAYARARVWMNETPAAEIARAEKEFFPKTDEAVLARCIEAYQKLGCWTPHVEITKAAFDVAQDVFRHFGTLKGRVHWEQVCCDPPA
jgi:NitT/TauT family transport system substrate-binding protein